MVVDTGRFINTISNITQESQELQRYIRAWRLIGKSTVIKYH